MVVSFRFFLTLNSDDGSKPTPTVETQPVFDGDGKFKHAAFPTARFSPTSDLGKVFPSNVCLSFIIIFSIYNVSFF